MAADDVRAGAGGLARRPTSRLAPALADALVRRRWLVLALCALLAAGSAAGLRDLEFSSDYRVFFSRQNPELEAFEALQKVYSKSDNLVFVLRPDHGDAFRPEVLGAARSLTDAAWRLPFATRVDGVVNFQHSHARGDELIVQDLVPADLEPTPARLARIRQIALAEPLLRDRLVSADATTLGVNVTLNPPQKSQDEVPLIMAEARRLAGELRAAHPHITVAITGQVALNNAFVEATYADLRTLIPIMYAMIALALLAFLRSLVAVLATVLVIGLSAVTAMGLAGWLGILLSPPSAVAPTIILTLAVADSVHILVTMLHERGRGASAEAALRESLRINFQPVFLTSLTTAIGFLSLNFSDAPPFRDLGNITALGVGAAWIYAVLFLPALLMVLPPRAPRHLWDRAPARMEEVAAWVIRHRRRVLVGTAVAVALLAAWIPRIELNDQFVDYFDPSIRFRADTDFATEHLSGIYQMHWSLPSGSSGGIAEPAYLERLHAFKTWLEARPEVVHVNSLSDVMVRLNRNLHGDDPAHHRLPDSRELAAQYLLLYEMSLPFGLDLNNRIDIDRAATRLVATLENITTADARALAAAARDWLDRNFESARGSPATGPFVMFAYISERNIQAMLYGTAVALALISIVLTVALRDLRLGLLSLIPNLVPVIVAFGLWALVIGEIGLAVSVVAATSLGIIVDNTVHFLSKYRRARREQSAGAAAAVRHAFRTVGAALLVTSAVLIAGFAMLALSAFQLNASLGLLTAISIAAALVADFTLLPALLLTLDRPSLPYGTVAAHEPAAAR
ncbi:MAG TPA: MMPL family transporter [Geminicoccaceae bacterium]